VPATFEGAFFGSTSMSSPQNRLPVFWSTTQTVLDSSGGFGTTFFAGVFAAFFETGAGDELAAVVVAFLLLVATGLAVFVTAGLRLAMMGKILGLRKMQ
jgi:hypothetical protein